VRRERSLTPGRFRTAARRRSGTDIAAGKAPTDAGRTVKVVLPPIENRDPGDETDAGD
jgi:hypothetical protein